MGEVESRLGEGVEHYARGLGAVRHSRATARFRSGPDLGLAIEELVDALTERRDVCWPAGPTAGSAAV
mgnify:CR=1 FL=1